MTLVHSGSSTILSERTNQLTDLRAYTLKSITYCTRSPSHTGLKKKKTTAKSAHYKTKYFERSIIQDHTLKK